MRIFIGFLFGVLVGVGGSAYFFVQGGKDSLFPVSPQFQRLAEDVRQVAQEQAHGARRLDETTTQVEHLTKQFADLERRFQAFASARQEPTAAGEISSQKAEATENAEVPSEGQ